MNVIYRDRPQWHGDHYETESIPYCAACEKIIEDIAHDFCGWCGSPLSDPTPLSLEQLREMDGQPVWISKLDKWGILSGKLVDVAEGETEYRMVIGFEYGWEWLDDVLRDGRNAYAHKPTMNTALRSQRSKGLAYTGIPQMTMASKLSPLFSTTATPDWA